MQRKSAICRDILYCKADFKLHTYQFKKDHTYKVTDYDAHLKRFKIGNLWMTIYSVAYILYFYSEQEVRKLKLKKLMK